MARGQAAKSSADIATLASEIERLPIDREFIPQDRLDLENRSRTSLFPWRGQFSPQFIETLLGEFASPGTTVLDPFVGIGTTLFESARKSLTCYGAEINPAAVEMASTVHFANVRMPERKTYIADAEAIALKHMSLPLPEPDLFTSLQPEQEEIEPPLREAVQRMLGEASSQPLVQSIISNAVIRHVGLRGTKGSRQFLQAFGQHKAIVEQLPYSQNPCKVFHRDARDLPVASQTVDLILTSPPYINVFNYHQHYRRAMELMGWNLLNVAKSEFGSNRKNRGNRFLTVIQYAIDILQALREMRRVIRLTGRIIIIIGKESKVRGIGFENGRILTALAVGAAGLRLALRQERKFLNRFGETIYEDILHFVPGEEPTQPADGFARSVAQSFLDDAVHYAPDRVREDVLGAIECAPMIEASPMYIIPHRGREMA
jgi:hypothetical protein